MKIFFKKERQKNNNKGPFNNLQKKWTDHSSPSPPGRLPRTLNRDGAPIDTVLLPEETTWSSEDIEPTPPPFTEGSNSSRSFKKPLWRNSKETSAEVVPCGWMCLQIYYFPPKIIMNNVTTWVKWGSLTSTSPELNSLSLPSVLWSYIHTKILVVVATEAGKMNISFLYISHRGTSANTNKKNKKTHHSGVAVLW